MSEPVVFRRAPLRRSLLRIAVTLVAAAIGAFAYAGAADAAPWCGSVASADRPAILGGKSIRVIYAIPADGVDQSAQRAPIMAADVDSIAAWWQGQDYARTPRFDLAAFPCGPQADIVLVRLPQAAGELRATEGRFSKIADFVAALQPGAKSLVYYDGPVDDVNICGEGGGSAEGPGVAIVYPAACPDVASNLVAVHELIHSFGALPTSGPPHGYPDSPGHVCDSSGDVMYTYAQVAMLDVFALDVGRDDYYAHNGTWLDVQDSQWLRHLEAPAAVLTVTPTGGGSVQSVEPGIDCELACSLEWDGGTQLVLQASPDPGKKFVRWSGACSGRDDCDLTISQPTAVQALFAPALFRLAVSRGGKGVVRSADGKLTCPSRCAASFDSFVPVALQAVPAKGWKLKRWTGACKGSARTCKVPMSASASARAVFVKKP